MMDNDGGNFLTSDGGKALSQVAGGFGAGMAASNTPVNSADAQAQADRQKTRDAAMASGNPYAMAAAAADGIIDGLGGYTSATQTGTNADVGNALASRLLPGAGFFVKKLPTITVSDEFKAMSGGYGGSANDVAQASQNSGAKALFGRKKIKRMIADAKQTMAKVEDIKSQADDAALIAKSMSARNAQANLTALQGGPDPLTRAAKDGMKLSQEDDEWFDQFFANNNFFNENLSKFQNGGTMNVIPDGALHARLHSIENVEHITKKGIPVIDQDGRQQAEIERNEIIFRIEVTKKIEELMEKYKENPSDQSIPIEAGKILTKEILHNTNDRTGLIKEIK